MREREEKNNLSQLGKLPTTTQGAEWLRSGDLCKHAIPPSTYPKTELNKSCETTETTTLVFL